MYRVDYSKKGPSSSNEVEPMTSLGNTCRSRMTGKVTLVGDGSVMESVKYMSIRPLKCSD